MNATATVMTASDVDAALTAHCLAHPWRVNPTGDGDHPTYLAADGTRCLIGDYATSVGWPIPDRPDLDQMCASDVANAAGWPVKAEAARRLDIWQEAADGVRRVGANPRWGAVPADVAMDSEF